jgi:hypothetical protein
MFAYYSSYLKLRPKICLLNAANNIEIWDVVVSYSMLTYVWLLCRRFNGHKRTIRPNAKKLGTLFPARHTMSWEDFADKVREFQKGFMGNPMEVGYLFSHALL